MVRVVESASSEWGSWGGRSLQRILHLRKLCYTASRLRGAVSGVGLPLKEMQLNLKLVVRMGHHHLSIGNSQGSPSLNGVTAKSTFHGATTRKIRTVATRCSRVPITAVQDESEMQRLRKRAQTGQMGGPTISDHDNREAECPPKVPQMLCGYRGLMIEGYVLIESEYVAIVILE